LQPVGFFIDNLGKIHLQTDRWNRGAWTMRMRASLLGLVAFLMAVPVLGAPDKPGTPPPGWKEFIDPKKGGLFSIWMPELPGRRTLFESSVTLRGSTYTVNYARLAAKDGPTFDADILTLPPRAGKEMSDDQKIELFRELYLGTVKGKVVGEKDLKETFAPGKEYSIETEKGLARVRVFALGSRVYRAGISGNKGQVDSKEATLYLTSFRLLAKASEEPVPEKKPEKKPDKEPVATPGPWTTDLTKMVIPDEPAAGKLMGGDFKVQSAKLEGSTLVLSQGKNLLPDVVVSIYLNKGESVEEKSFEFSPGSKPGLKKPQIHYSRKLPADKLPKKEATAGGYALKLEFGKAMDGMIPVKIFLCLPDAAKSYVAGVLTAEVKK